MTESCESCKHYFPIYWDIVELKEGHRDAAFKIQGTERTQLIRIKTLVPYAQHIKSPINWCSFHPKRVIVRCEGDCKQKKLVGI